VCKFPTTHRAMPPIKPRTVKRALLRAGFEIYRTAVTFVLCAERVRDNLTMGSGVAVGLPAESASDGSAGNGSATAQQGGEHDWEQQGLVVRVVLKAQASEFPNEEGEGLLAHARALAGPVEGRGYRETSTQTVVVKDPGDGTR